jgi:hypothetical protein
MDAARLPLLPGRRAPPPAQQIYPRSPILVPFWLANTHTQVSGTPASLARCTTSPSPHFFSLTPLWGSCATQLHENLAAAAAAAVIALGTMEGRGQGTTAAGEGRAAAARLIQRTWRAHVLHASFTWVRRRLVRVVGGGEGEPGLRTACSTSLQDHVERLTSPRTQRPHPRTTPRPHLPGALAALGDPEIPVAPRAQALTGPHHVNACSLPPERGAVSPAGRVQDPVPGHEHALLFRAADAAGRVPGGGRRGASMSSCGVCWYPAR